MRALMWGRVWAVVLAASAAIGTAAAAPPPIRQVGQLVYDGVPDDNPAALAELRAKVESYSDFKPVRAAHWLADGSLLILARDQQTVQLHQLAGPMQPRKLMKTFADPVLFAAPRPLQPIVGAVIAAPKDSQPPSGPQVVVGVDKDGAEFYQLWLLDQGRDTARLLTDGKSRHEHPRWSRDGGKLAFVGTARNAKDFDLYVWDGGDAAPRLAMELQGTWRVEDWSPAGDKLILSKYNSIESVEPWLVDLAAGTKQPLLGPGVKAAFADLRYGPDGSVWFASDLGGDHLRLGQLNLDGKVQWYGAEIPWQVEDVAVSPSGRVAVLVNEDGISRLYTPGPQGKLVRLPDLPKGVASALDFAAAPQGGERLAVTVTSASSPGDAWSVVWPALAAPLPKAKGKPSAAAFLERWSETRVGSLDPKGFVEPSLVRYPTFDRDAKGQRQVPCFVYLPQGPGPFPFVIHIHGGPEGQARPWFDPSIQLWARELGVAVLVPNVRGSDGYGKAWLALDNAKLREDSVKDIGALLDWAARQPKVYDAKRAAVYGGSYGGYMVLAALVKYGERLKAGVDIVGISNFVTFLENTKSYRRDNRRAEYGDESDPTMRDFLQRISPLSHANRIRSRLFVVQGANDPRVPASEAEQMVAAVRGAGQAVWYLLAKDEGHGFQKKANRDAMMAAVLAFWKQHLL
jgi:dipeptidyl aminopeptidase/acylaminoacyl peptidase